MAKDVTRPLLRLSREMPTSEQFKRALVGLRPHAARGAALIAGAQLDFALFIALASKLRPLDQGDMYLFEDGAPYSTTALKIDACYSLGIIGRVSKKEMKLLSRIRNAFAHATISVQFSTQEIVDACATLDTMEIFPQFKDRKRYRRSEFPWNSTQDRYKTAIKIYAERLMVYYHETRFPFANVGRGMATIRMQPEPLP